MVKLSPPPSTARRKNDPEAMRARILDTAAALFQSNGYTATTTNMIATSAGVTHGAMHYHFPTKKELGLAVIRERVADVIRETWVEPMRRERTALVAIARIFEEIAAGLDRNRKVEGCPLNNFTIELALGDADFRDEVRPIFDEWRGAISERVIKDQARGDLRRVDPQAFATHVVASCSGAMAIGKATQSSDALRLVAHQIEQSYL